MVKGSSVMACKVLLSLLTHYIFSACRTTSAIISNASAYFYTRRHWVGVRGQRYQTGAQHVPLLAVLHGMPITGKTFTFAILKEKLPLHRAP
jgi:hypothetical protein